jgi:hypothetical protein
VVGRSGEVVVRVFGNRYTATTATTTTTTTYTTTTTTTATITICDDAEEALPAKAEKSWCAC